MENTNIKNVLEHKDPVTTVYIHGLKYEVDEVTNQACFYVQDIEENSQTLDRNNKQFLWQSQKWIVTHYDERKTEIVKKNRPRSHRSFKRRLKKENEGDDYEITEVISLDVTEDHNGTSHLREYIWKPNKVNKDETFMLVTYADSCETSVKQTIPDTRSTAYVGGKRDDFEITYDGNDDYYEDYEEQPEGALAKITYVSEKLAHIRKLEPNEDQEVEEEDVYEIEPINLKISFEPVTMWVTPYEGRYGLSTSHFQVSERLGDSCETSLIKVTTRGGYLSDFSLSYSEVRKLKKYRHHHEKQPQYNYLPTDVIVIDKLEEETQPSQQASCSDDEGFEEIEAEHTRQSEPVGAIAQKPSSPQSNYGSDYALPSCRKDSDSETDSDDNLKIYGEKFDEITKQSLTENEKDRFFSTVPSLDPYNTTKPMIDEVNEKSLNEFICNGIVRSKIRIEELETETILSKAEKMYNITSKIIIPEIHGIKMKPIPSAAIVTVASDSNLKQVRKSSKYAEIDTAKKIQEDNFEETYIKSDVHKQEINLDFMLENVHQESLNGQSLIKSEVSDQSNFKLGVTDQCNVKSETTVTAEKKSLGDENELLRREGEVLGELLEFRDFQSNGKLIICNEQMEENVLSKPPHSQTAKVFQQKEERDHLFIMAIPSIQTNYVTEAENINTCAKKMCPHRTEVKEELLQSRDDNNTDAEKEIEFDALFFSDACQREAGEQLVRAGNTTLVDSLTSGEKLTCQNELPGETLDDEVAIKTVNKMDVCDSSFESITVVNPTLQKKRTDSDELIQNDNPVDNPISISASVSKSYSMVDRGEKREDGIDTENTRDVVSSKDIILKPTNYRSKSVSLDVKSQATDIRTSQVNPEISLKPKKKSLTSRAKKAIMKPFKGKQECPSKSETRIQLSRDKVTETTIDNTGKKKKKKLVSISKLSDQKKSTSKHVALPSDVRHKNVVYRRSDTVPVKSVADRIVLLRQNSSEGMLGEDERRAARNRRKLVRSQSFESILDSCDKLETELEGRRKRLAGYAYSSHGNLVGGNEIVKSREYTIEACEKEMTKEIGIIKRGRKKSSTYKSMETSLDAVSKMKTVGHVQIPGVFLGSSEVDIGCLKLKNNQVGKIIIPRAFSVDNLENADLAILKTKEMII